MFRLANPWMLLTALFAALPVMGAIFRERGPRLSRLLYSEISPLRGLPPSPRARAAILLPYAQAFSVVLAAVALARPQAGPRIQHVTTEGIDIVVALDVSGSMRAEDFAPKNRMYVARRTIGAFIDGRKSDR